MKAVYLIERLQCFPHYKVTPLRGGATSQPNFTGIDFIHLAFITASSYLAQKNHVCVCGGVQICAIVAGSWKTRCSVVSFRQLKDLNKGKWF